MAHDLPSDIFELIVRVSSDERQQTRLLLDFSLVSRHFHQLSVPLLYSNVSIANPNTPNRIIITQSSKFFAALRSNPSLVQHIKKLFLGPLAIANWAWAWAFNTYFRNSSIHSLTLDIKGSSGDGWEAVPRENITALCMHILPHVTVLAIANCERFSLATIASSLSPHCMLSLTRTTTAIYNSLEPCSPLSIDLLILDRCSMVFKDSRDSLLACISAPDANVRRLIIRDAGVHLCQYAYSGNLTFATTIMQNLNNTLTELHLGLDTGNFDAKFKDPIQLSLPTLPNLRTLGLPTYFDEDTPYANRKKDHKDSLHAPFPPWIVPDFAPSQPSILENLILHVSCLETQSGSWPEPIRRGWFKLDHAFGHPNLLKLTGITLLFKQDVREEIVSSYKQAIRSNLPLTAKKEALIFGDSDEYARKHGLPPFKPV